MGKKNNKMNQVNEVVETNTPAIEESVADPIVEEVAEPIVEEVTKPEPEVEKPKKEKATVFIAGFVSGCTSLYVREAPTKGAKAVCKIPADTDVSINVNKSTDKWYRIVTFDGIEGFCMKEFITLR